MHASSCCPSQSRVKEIAAGARHCVALTQGGTVLTWGIGSQGQLGRLPAFDQNSQPTAEDLFVPKPVPNATNGLGRSAIAAIATGGCKG